MFGIKKKKPLGQKSFPSNSFGFSPADHFFMEHSTTLQSLQHRASAPKIKEYTDFESYILAYENTIQALDELEKFCFQYPGGVEWFNEMYHHCHNSRTKDFSLADQIREGYQNILNHPEQFERKFPRSC